ncbi:NTP transferase domain-containing protein [Micromonospora sp. WMMA1363]|uniref:molybdenum cofactor guanylyltransferase n=1 Tax=Micromonospora sp. WMMA1363 TaxID=3053985 RepID=UPI00259D160D|nr:NTP transferase domain-containing protein [Micromonospora sp. WMMA1363]MDM4721757.1 NTP transferase domain-containing protein [Micromonospora sp. WMMA1363]
MTSQRRGHVIYRDRVSGYAAVLLAGGSARRMGGLDKPARPVGGRPMRDWVLTAVADADPRILVGPAAGVPAGVRVTREEPPGGGPVAATAAGLALLPVDATVVALLAADLPLLTRVAVGVLLHHLDVGVDGACFVDDTGRRQTLCGAWRVAALRDALDRLATERPLAGAPLRASLRGLLVREVPWRGDGPPPWFDCDTDEDVRRAEEWAR